MAHEVATSEEPVLIGEEIDHVRLITLNRPRQLNIISSKTVSLLAENLEKWEKDDNAELVIIKGSGRAFSAGGDLKMFYDDRKSKDSCLEVVYRMYWLCLHIHTYKKTQGLWLRLLKLGPTDDPLSLFEYGTIIALIKSDAEGIGGSGFVECIREHINSLKTTISRATSRSD